MNWNKSRDQITLLTQKSTDPVAVRAWYSLGKQEWTCCNYSLRIRLLGNNKEIKYSSAVESERTVFDCIRMLRTTRKISNYNTIWPCLHGKKSICVGGIFSFFLPQFSSTNLTWWLSVVGVLRMTPWTVSIYLAFIFQCSFFNFFSPRHKGGVVLWSCYRPWANM